MDFAPAGQEFWLRDGRKLCSVKELSTAIESMDDSLFYYHVNSQKNDFMNWIRDVFKERELAARLSGARLKGEIKRELSLFLEKNAEKISKVNDKGTEKVHDKIEDKADKAKVVIEIKPKVSEQSEARQEPRQEPKQEKKQELIQESKEEFKQNPEFGNPDDRETKEILERINQLVKEDKKIEQEEEEIIAKENQMIQIIGHRVPSDVFVKGLLSGIALSAMMIVTYAVLFG